MNGATGRSRVEVGEPTSALFPALPLDGLRVLDLTTQVGVYCGKLLADAGADVIKVEPPGGDALRFKPPFAPGVAAPEASVSFAYYNNNKRGITLDCAVAAAQPVLERLAASADAVVASPGPRHPLVGLAVDAERPEWVPREAVFCAITPFGRTGPYRNWRATPFTSFAASGLMHHVGELDGPPLAMPGQQIYDSCSTRAAGAIAAHLLTPARTGATLDLSAHELGTWHKQVVERYSLAGRITNRETNFSPPPSGIWRCRDGWIDIAAHSPHHWTAFVELLGCPDDLTDDLYADRSMRVMLFDLLAELIGAHLTLASAPEIVARGQSLGLPCALRYLPDEFLHDVQPAARGTLVSIDHPTLGEITMPGPVGHADPPAVRYRRPAPRLGEANVEVYVEELGFTLDQLHTWERDGLV